VTFFADLSFICFYSHYFFKMLALSASYAWCLSAGLLNLTINLVSPETKPSISIKLSKMDLYAKQN
jgi:hypothetical protein